MKTKITIEVTVLDNYPVKTTSDISNLFYGLDDGQVSYEDLKVKCEKIK